MSDDHHDPGWGAEHRDRKAQNILECLALLTDLDLSRCDCVDIGCGSGGISFHLAPAFRSVTGVDPEPWKRWEEFTAEQPNLRFVEASIESLGIDDDSVDVVICNQVYEHVPDPQVLIAQILRILRQGGTCYFAGPNLLYPIEPHVHWPFIHWIPRRWALSLLRTFAPEKVLDAHSTTYWRLRRWLSAFAITDAVPALVKHRAFAPGASPAWRVFRAVPMSVLGWLGFLSPGFVFILEKPDDGRHQES